MKRFALPLGLIAFALACTDATSPSRHAALTLKDPTIAAALGDKPPPPVDAAIEITISSPGSAIFTGVYFSNGKISDDGVPVPTFDGTAWLRLDNTQPTRFGTASANARFMNQDNKLSGMGTLTFLEGGVSVSYTITSVEEFTPLSPNSDCAFNFQPCVFIRFKATDKDGNVHDGTLTAFNVEGCVFVPVEGSGGYFSCPE